MPNQNEILLCYHCGNRVPLRLVSCERGKQLYEHDGAKRYEEDFEYLLYKCPTCEGVSIFGDFIKYPRQHHFGLKRLYPKGAELLPESYKIQSSDCVPEKIMRLYEEIWPLRHIAPNAFVGQLRRALEFICRDKQAKGENLFQQLKYLVDHGTFPGYFIEMTDLMRRVGNLGAHAGDEPIDFWSAEILDDFFRAVIEYVYIAPSRIDRLKARIAPQK